jgi:hypothetical protein
VSARRLTLGVRFILMKNTMKIIGLGIITAALSISLAFPEEEGRKIYSDVASFKAGFDIGITERNIDINNDGNMDVLLFSYAGEETILYLLVKELDHFVYIGIPAGESYDILENPRYCEIKIGFGTFPTFSDIHGPGPDKYYWYDFYQVIGVTLTNTNSRHRDFYKDMKKLYEKRIGELEEEIKRLEKEKSEKGSDVSVLDLFAQFKRDHIQRYREFIKKALIIIQGKSGT